MAKTPRKPRKTPIPSPEIVTAPAEPTAAELARLAAASPEPEPGPRPAGGDAVFHVADLALWKSLTNFVVDYEDTSDYWRPRIRKRPIFLDAVAKAIAFFEKEGALAPIAFADDAIAVHCHPKTHTVVFLFKRSVAGTAKECAVEYPLTPAMIGWLRATERWKDITEH